MAVTKLTQLRLKNNQVVYTTMPPSEVRPYLSKGVSMGAIKGFEDTAMKVAVHIGVHAIVLIYADQVSST